MKRILLMLVLLMGVVMSAWAEKTPQAIWCRNNKTMYFTNDETVYAPGDTYDGETVTNVWSGVDVTNAIGTTLRRPLWVDVVSNSLREVRFDPSFSDVRPVSTESWFEDCRYLASVEGLEYLNTSEVKRTLSMFYNCKSLTTLDVNSFDLRKVTVALAMFGSCENLVTIYCDNDWSEMFQEEQYIFRNCYKLKGAVSYSNTEDHVTSAMANPVTGYFTKRWPINFNPIGNGTVVASDDNPYTNQTVTLAPVPDDGYALFDILVTRGTMHDVVIPHTNNGNGTYTFTMPAEEVTVDAWFAAATPQVVWCSGNSTLFFTNPMHQYQVGDTFEGQEVTAVWNGDAVTNSGTGAPGWSDYSSNVTKVVFKHDFIYVKPESLGNWLRDMTNLSEIEGIEFLNTSQAENMSHMFANCKLIQTIDLNSFEVMSGANTTGMFQGCEALTTIYCDKAWNIPSIISANMFLGCTSLKGAIAYDNTWINGALANPDTGYFTKQWTLHVGNIEHGTVRLSEATPFTNELVTITLTPDAHYRVKNFTLTGNSSGFNYYFSDNGDGTYTFIMPPEDITLGVEFFCPTANAIWCEGNHTLYFDYDYAPSLGSIYEGQIVTKLWTDDRVTNTEWNVPGWRGYAKDAKKVVFQTAFSTVRPKSLYYWFWNMSELETIEGIENLNTSETTNMSSMFFGCAKLTSLDVSGFDVRKLPSTISMFRECTSLTTIYCNNTWNNPNANNMFLGCTSLKGAVAYNDTKVNGAMANPADGYFTGKWNLNVGDHDYGTIELAQSWAYTNDTVTVSFSPDEGYALYGCVVKGDRTGNEVEVTMANDTTCTFVMPAEAVTVSALFQLANEPFVVWCDDSKTLYFDCSLKPHVGDTYNGHSVTSVWSGEQVTETSIYYPYWHTTEVKKVVFSPAFANVRPNGCAYWFYGCSDLEEIEGLEYLNTSEVTTMVWMFRDCGSLKTINVNNFDMTNVTDVSYMFFDCYALTTIYCNNTWNVANSSSMFTYDTKLVGAVHYNSNYQDASMANPVTGYFTGQWDVTIDDNIEHGTVTCEKDWAYTNEIVTITFTPDQGYVLEAPTVTIASGDGQGGTIQLTPGDEPGTYNFKMPAAPVTVNATFARMLGDVDCDGEVTTADITAIYNFLLNEDDTYIATSDVNGDGFITAADITVIYNILLGSK